MVQGGKKKKKKTRPIKEKKEERRGKRRADPEEKKEQQYYELAREKEKGTFPAKRQGKKKEERRPSGKENCPNSVMVGVSGGKDNGGTSLRYSPMRKWVARPWQKAVLAVPQGPREKRKKKA